jgi:AraC-like DNA-binding protein
MDSFQIIQPSALLSPFVKQYWLMTVNSAVQASERVIPTGMMCLMFHRGERIFSSSENEWQPRAFLSGQDTSYTDLSYCGGIDMISIEFRPGGAKAFFKMPMIELYGQAVAIGVLSDPLLAELEKRLYDAADAKTSVLLIENFLYKRLYQLDAYNVKRINAVMQSIYGGQQNIEALAGTACLGYKQFKRIFASYIGANPKDYLRIVRFQKALHILQLQPGISLTQLTYDCGYYDQAHFIKEFKQFSGYTPTEYMAVCEPHSDFFTKKKNVRFIQF